jgi:hypothetical protein
MFDLKKNIKLLLSSKLAINKMSSVKLAVKNMYDVKKYIKVLLYVKLAYKKNVKRKVGLQKYV